MRKTLLFIKVCLLLAAFVSSSSSHAAKFGEHNIVGDSTSNFDLALGSATIEEDDQALFDSDYISTSYSASSITIDYVSVVAKHLVSTNIARAPPVNSSL